MRETLGEVYNLLFGASLVLSPAYLLPAVLVAWVVYRRQGQGGGFWRWLVPRRISARERCAIALPSRLRR